MGIETWSGGLWPVTCRKGNFATFNSEPRAERRVGLVKTASGRPIALLIGLSADDFHGEGLRFSSGTDNRLKGKAENLFDDRDHVALKTDQKYEKPNV